MSDRFRLSDVMELRFDSGRSVYGMTIYFSTQGIEFLEDPRGGFGDGFTMYWEDIIKYMPKKFVQQVGTKVPLCKSYNKTDASIDAFIKYE